MASASDPAIKTPVPSRRPPSSRVMEADAELQEVHVETKETLDRIKKLAAEVMTGSGQHRLSLPPRKPKP